MDAAGRLQAQEDICAFAEWVHDGRKLVPYLTDDAKIIAAVQHHQVTPTTFIDFLQILLLLAGSQLKVV